MEHRKRKLCGFQLCKHFFLPENSIKIIIGSIIFPYKMEGKIQWIFIVLNISKTNGPKINLDVLFLFTKSNFAWTSPTPYNELYKINHICCIVYNCYISMDLISILLGKCCYFQNMKLSNRQLWSDLHKIIYLAKQKLWFKPFTSVLTPHH